MNWQTRKTRLIVGEGYDEVAFLNHVKQFPGVCGKGVVFKIANAKGKGAAHVIDCAIKLSANVAYDFKAAWLDTDTDWSPTVAKRARSKGIQVMASDPCFEALLLRILRKTPDLTGDLKKQLSPFVQNDSTRPESYSFHFSFAVLDEARQREPSLDSLLKVFGI